MQLTPGVTISPGQQVSRQTIYDLVANALGGSVDASDLAVGVLPIKSQAGPPDPYPGQLWYDTTDELLKLYVDMIDGTGVSLWVAVGPDRFDIPLLATEPIPFGAAVQLTCEGRKACLPPAPDGTMATDRAYYNWQNWKVVGFNNNGIAASAETTASGSWFAAAKEGIVWCWYPLKRGAVSSDAGQYDALISTCSGTTGPYGYSMVRGGLIAEVTGSAMAAKRSAFLAYSTYILDCGATNYARRVFLGATAGRI